MVTELRHRVEHDRCDEEPLETVYVGGGTPSLLPAEGLAGLLTRLRHTFPDAAGPPEITLEANPDDVTRDAARDWVAAGVTRVSLGVQSFEPAVLEWMHRTHRAEASREAVQHLRAAGVPSVSLDLIFGLPPEAGGSAGAFRRDLDRALALGPEHLSVYGLTTERGTALFRWVERGAVRPATDLRYQEQFLMADAVLTAEGFRHYEVSNYARPGAESRHNQAYWTGRPYLGLGPSAHSYRPPVRRWNVRDWAAYERVTADRRDPVGGSERLTADQQALEQVYLGLRTEAGVSRDAWGRVARGVAQAAQREGWLVETEARVRLTPMGWLRLDELVAALTTWPEGG